MMCAIEKSNWQNADGWHYKSTISAKIPGYERMHDQMERILAASLPGQAPRSLLVVGAGGGHEIEILGTRHEAWTFTGIDPSAPMLHAAEQQLKQAGLQERTNLIRGTVVDIPHALSFDGATCMLVLHFLEDFQQKLELLRGIAGHLKSGAPLILATISADQTSQLYPIMMNAWRSHMLAAGIEEQEWDRFAHSIGQESYPVAPHLVEKLLEEAGFVSVVRYFGSFLVEGYAALRK